MKKNDINLKQPDFVWNKNRLALEKQQIKEQMMKVIKKNPAKKE